MEIGSAETGVTTIPTKITELISQREREKTISHHLILQD